jgi:predicted dehydrogenase
MDPMALLRRPWLIPAYEKCLAAMLERFLIVGFGSIGRRHLRSLRRLRQGCHVAVLRSGLSASPASPLDASVAECRSWEEALAFAPQAAIVAGPATTHVASARRLIEAGIPVLLEKPLAEKLSGASELVQLAQSLRVPAAIGYNLRQRPSLMRVRSLLVENAIGAVVAVRAEVGQYLPDWRPGTRYQDGVSARRALGGGPLLELSHEFDYLYWMFGLPDTVTARGGLYSSLEIDVEDVVEVTLEFAGQRRMLVNVHMDFLQRAPDRRCRFIGAEGTLIWDGIADTIDIFRTETGQWERITFPPAEPDASYSDQLQRFLAAAEGAASALPTLAEGYDVLTIATAAACSMKKGRSVRIERGAVGLD